MLIIIISKLPGPALRSNTRASESLFLLRTYVLYIRTESYHPSSAVASNVAAICRSHDCAATSRDLRSGIPQWFGTEVLLSRPENGIQPRFNRDSRVINECKTRTKEMQRMTDEARQTPEEVADALPPPSIFSKRQHQLPRSQPIRFCTVAASSGSNVFKEFEQTETSSDTLDSQIVEIQACVETSQRTCPSQLLSQYKSRQAHNQAIGKDLANTPERPAGCTENDLRVLNHLLAHL